MLPPAPSVYQPRVDGEGVEQRDRTCLSVAVDRHADALEAHLHEEAEELPVVLRRLAALDAAQPLDDVVALAPGERVPQVLGCERQREPDRGHLDHPLVDGIPARDPSTPGSRDRCRWRARPTTGPSARRSRRRPRGARCPTAVVRSPPVRRPAARTSTRSCRGAPVRRRGRGARRRARRGRPPPGARRPWSRAGCPPSGLARASGAVLDHAIRSRSSARTSWRERFAGEEAADLGHREVAHARDLGAERARRCAA